MSSSSGTEAGAEEGTEEHALGSEEPGPDTRTPLERLGVLATQQVEVTETLRHLEMFTMEGMLTVLWHGAHDAEKVVIACGGAMGGLLGPAEGLYHALGEALVEDDIAVLRIGYRKPNDLGTCTLDVAAAAEVSARQGGRRMVIMGHSFGGAIAVRVGAFLPEVVVGVVTLATQSAGCEVAGHLAGRPLLLFHGDADELLPVQASEVVRQLAGGTGELVVLPGTGHLLTQSSDAVRERLLNWIPEVLAMP